MMTLILIVAFLLIAFIGLLRYDIHKHKYSDEAQAKQAANEADKQSKPE